MFKPQFAELVKSGQKRQTIRPMPKRMPKAGNLESWRQWKGRPYRPGQIELAQVRLTSVQVIHIDHQGAFIGGPLSGQLISEEDQDNFAIADGFKNFGELLFWFDKQHGLPFKGILIKAENL